MKSQDLRSLSTFAAESMLPVLYKKFYSAHYLVLHKNAAAKTAAFFA